MLARLLIALLFLTGCRDDPPPAPLDIAEAEGAVTRWYTAAMEGDCETILALTADRMTQADCDGLVADFKAHGAKFVGIAGSKLDGRDRTAVLVTAKLTFQNRYGTDKKWITRAVRTSDGWRVHSP